MGNFDYQSGLRYMAEGELDEAIRCFLSSLDLDPASVPTYLALLGAYEQVWHELGDPQALEQMRKVAVAGLKRDPDPEHERLLREGLDRADEGLVAVREAEELITIRRDSAED